MDTVTFLAHYKQVSLPVAEKYFKVWQRKADLAGQIPSQMMRKLFEFYPKGKQHRGALTVLGYELAMKKKLEMSPPVHAEQLRAGNPKSKSNSSLQNPNSRLNEDILKASIAVEMLQAAMLITDDVFDNDALRRGEPTLHKQWEVPGSAEYGKDMAFNTAIIAFYLAPLSLLDTDFEKTDKLKALTYFFEKTIETGWGEAMDISSPFLTSEAKQQSTAQIHYYKTISYSTVLPLVFGALLTGIDNADFLANLTRYGENLGRVFQIQDDILGSFGETSQSGKASDTDIKQARWTILMELLDNLMSPSEKKTDCKDL